MFIPLMDPVVDRAMLTLQKHCQLYPFSDSCHVFSAKPSEFINSAGIPQMDKTGCESVTLYSTDKLPVIVPHQTALPNAVAKFM